MSWFGLPPGDVPLAFWTIVVCIVCNISCALLGCYLVLRRMSLLGDALSHGVLPGIAVAFLVTGQLNGWYLLVGAVVFGVLTAFLTQTLTTFGNVPEDASMGVVFTSLFALGVILISKFAGHVDLDPNCVFYGLLEFIPLHTFPFLGLEIPVAFPKMAFFLALTLAFLLLFWKELKIASFDPDLATAMGLNATLVHYLLMAMIAGVTVTSFEVMGSIIVVAMLIVPGATAHLFTDRLRTMMIWSAVVAALSAILGYAVSRLIRHANVAGMMAVMAGVQFGLAVLFAPRHGLVARMVHNFRLARRIAEEDILAVLFRREEAGGAVPEAVRVAEERPAPLLGWLARRNLHRLGQVLRGAQGTMALTDTGRERAVSIVRSHRLWETFLEKNFNLPLDHLHEPATRMEHFIGPALQHELEAELHQPGRDPHGRSIPSAEPKQ